MNQDAESFAKFKDPYRRITILSPLSGGSIFPITTASETEEEHFLIDSCKAIRALRTNGQLLRYLEFMNYSPTEVSPWDMASLDRGFREFVDVAGNIMNLLVAEYGFPLGIISDRCYEANTTALGLREYPDTEEERRD